jgi:hypothetical protein
MQSRQSLESRQSLQSLQFLRKRCEDERCGDDSVENGRVVGVRNRLAELGDESALLADGSRPDGNAGKVEVAGYKAVGWLRSPTMIGACLAINCKGDGHADHK